MRIVVATPATATPYWRVDYGGAVAVVVGGERHGVSDAWRNAADECVAIAMQDPVDSLNVGVATGVVLCEAARQRELRGSWTVA